MRKDTIHSHLRVFFLRDFLEHVADDAATEAGLIFHRIENGELSENEDPESAFDRPHFRVDFAVRGVYYELNALVEHHLQQKATPLFDDQKRKGKWKNKRSVDQIPLWAVLEMLESRYGALSEKLPGWSEFQQLRSAVNAFKHSQSRRRVEDMTQDSDGNWVFHWKPSLDEAKRLLKNTPELIDSIAALDKQNA